MRNRSEYDPPLVNGAGQQRNLQTGFGTMRSTYLWDYHEIRLLNCGVKREKQLLASISATIQGQIGAIFPLA